MFSERLPMVGMSVPKTSAPGQCAKSQAKSANPSPLCILDNRLSIDYGTTLVERHALKTNPEQDTPHDKAGGGYSCGPGRFFINIADWVGTMAFIFPELVS